MFGKCGLAFSFTQFFPLSFFFVWKVDHSSKSDVNGSWQLTNLPCKCISKRINFRACSS